MQTLKTAAVVVLLMTVMYSAYISITTPPEPLPDAVTNLLESDSEFGIDVGFPDSLVSVGDDNADPSADAGSLGVAAGDPSSPPNFEADTPNLATENLPGSGVSGSLSDDAMSLSPSPGSNAAAGIDPAMNDTLGGDRLASRGIQRLAGGTVPNADIKIDPSRDYPSTGGSFDLPDPSAAAARFESTSGSEFNLDAGETDVMTNDEVVDAATNKNQGLLNAIETADRQYLQGEKNEALATLSLFYETPDLSAEERTELLSRLDPLARDVIYSQAHLLEQPRRVRQNETLVDIGAEYDVPWQLIANINGIEDPLTVLPGTDLKVVRGPFRADVDLSEQELTLFVGDLYAGRFPVAIGSDPEPQQGTFTVQDKKTDKTYYNESGSPIPAGSPNNPYGTMWLDLGGQLCIHGSPNATAPSKVGCISVAGRHAKDLQGILSRGSSVVIRR